MIIPEEVSEERRTVERAFNRKDFRLVNKLGEFGWKALIEIRSGRIPLELLVAGCTTVMEQKMGAEAENMIMVVVLPSVRGGAQQYVRR